MSDKTAITEDYQKRFLWIMQRVPVTITLYRDKMKRLGVYRSKYLDENEMNVYQ